MLIPLVNADISLLSTDASKVQLSFVERLGVASEVYVAVPPSARTATGAISAKPLLRAARVFAGPFGADDTEGALAWLDAGALMVWFDCDIASTNGVLSIAEALSAMPVSRVLVRVLGAPIGSNDVAPSIELEAALSALSGAAAGFIFPCTTLPSAKVLLAIAAAAPRARRLYAPEAGVALTITDIGRLHRAEADVVCAAFVSASAADAEAGATRGQACVGTALASCVRSDRVDGLFTTVVSDEFGKALGLVYSSRESVAEAVRVGRGVYYSRSRNGLWRKGDTSGNHQLLKSIALDCDADALLFTVKQIGEPPAFCHLSTRTCWGEDGGLIALEVSFCIYLFIIIALCYAMTYFLSPPPPSSPPHPACTHFSSS